MEIYLRKRDNLMTTFLLVDSRLPMQENDRLMINWFGENQLPFMIILTKTDKLSSAKLTHNLEEYRLALSAEWEEIPALILTSAQTRRGREEILQYIEDTNRLFRKPDKV